MDFSKIKIMIFKVQIQATEGNKSQVNSKMEAWTKVDSKVHKGSVHLWELAILCQATSVNNKTQIEQKTLFQGRISNQPGLEMVDSRVITNTWI